LTFDYTYITLFGYPVFEPMVLVTNLIFFILCTAFFRKLNTSAHSYSRQMGWFIVLLGISSCFGAVGHAVHYQLGPAFLKTIIFLMNAFSLFSIYYCFRAPYTYYSQGREPSRKYIYAVLVWIFALLVFSGIRGDFTIIKIHAGLVLLYSLIVHYLIYRRSYEAGSGIVTVGIIISFLPIIVHTLRFSLHAWFNYKDIAHVIMIISLVVIYKGVSLTNRYLNKNRAEEKT
jgi:hypothetical protein